MPLSILELTINAARLCRLACQESSENESIKFIVSLHTGRERKEKNLTVLHSALACIMIFLNLY